MRSTLLVILCMLALAFFAQAQDNTISIRGSVVKPGAYFVDPNAVTTVRTLIERAGGLAAG